MSSRSMDDITSLKAILSAHRLILERRFHVKEIGIFGSFIRGEQTRKSDVDILVTFSEPIGLDFIALSDYLHRILKRKVDLVTPGGLRDELKQAILHDVIYA